MHRGQGFGDARVDIENRDQVGAFKEAADGVAGAGEFESIASGFRPHVSQDEFAESVAVEGEYSRQIHDHALRCGKNLGDQTGESAGVPAGDHAPLAVEDHCAFEA